MKEIERRWVVTHWSDSDAVKPTRTLHVAQGYLTSGKRCRHVTEAGNHSYFFTGKMPISSGVMEEDEREVTLDEFSEVARLARPVVSKTRQVFHVGGLAWELDTFHGRHSGLRVLEVELPEAALGGGVHPSILGRFDMDGVMVDPESLLSSFPSFRGFEVTGDPQYSNSHLAGCEHLPCLVMPEEVREAALLRTAVWDEAFSHYVFKQEPSPIYGAKAVTARQTVRELALEAGGKGRLQSWHTKNYWVYSRQLT